MKRNNSRGELPAEDTVSCLGFFVLTVAIVGAVVLVVAGRMGW